MSKLYTFLKYFFIVFWAVFVVAPFLWALTTSFKDFQSVNGGVTYIPWVDFEPNLEGWKVLIKSPAKGGVDIIEPYFNSLFVTCTASLISIILGTLSAYALSRYTFKAGFVKNNDITFFFISQRIMPPIVLSIPFFLFLSELGKVYQNLFTKFYDPIMEGVEERLVKRKRALISPLKDAILEVGSGTGGNFKFYNEFATVIARESSESMLNKSKIRVGDTPTKIRLIDSGINDKDLLNCVLGNSFDAIV